MSRIVPWDFEKEEADKEEATRRHHLLLEVNFIPHTFELSFELTSVVKKFENHI